MAVPVPGLYWIRFAFPVLADWTAALQACGAEPLLYYGDGVFLTRARNLGVIQSCHLAARRLSWVEPFLTTDRIAPALLDAADLEMRPYSLVFAPGTTRLAALAELPAAVEPGGDMTWQDGSLSLGVLAGAPELEALLRTSRLLLAIHPAESEPKPSDERQGQIIAGNYAGYPAASSGAVTATGYLTWLTDRKLRTASNQQTVAVVDTGYDDGTVPTGDHHPDMENPERLRDQESQKKFVFSPSTSDTADRRGHGTFVAGIIAGGRATSGTTDAQGFKLGVGIAPDVKLVAVQLFDNTTTCVPRSGLGDHPPDMLGAAITFSRVTTTGADKALIANHSWNTGENTYTEIAKLFDERVIDADGVDPLTNGYQPMLMVVAAGNSGKFGANTVLAPATAKNVVSVAATQNYRPSTQPGAPTNSCTNPSIALPEEYTREANNIAEISAFSSQGPVFGRLGSGLLMAHEVFNSPHVAAPGGKVFSVTPYLAASYGCSDLCRVAWPLGSSYTFSSGTSFAAPVVTAVAAHLRKWFQDRLTLNPAPSLIKAALMCTATDLGAALGGDYRPSHKQGMGRVDLNRATDPAVSRFYVNENGGLAVTTGVERTWLVTVDNPALPTYIVLAWSDPASPITAGHPPVINDLRLRVDFVGGAARSWYGNNFSENVVGIDNGYSHTYIAPITVLNDSMNNVEAIFIPAGTFAVSTDLQIRVIGANVAQGSQKFSVYAYNMR